MEGPWILGLPRKISMVKLGIEAGRWSRVCDLHLDDGMGWNSDLIREICIKDSANAILNMAWPDTIEADRLLWCGNKYGSFTMSNCYAINVHSLELERSL